MGRQSTEKSHDEQADTPADQSRHGERDERENENLKCGIHEKPPITRQPVDDDALRQGLSAENSILTAAIQ